MRNIPSDWVEPREFVQALCRTEASLHNDASAESEALRGEPGVLARSVTDYSSRFRGACTHHTFMNIGGLRVLAEKYDHWQRHGHAAYLWRDKKPDGADAAAFHENNPGPEEPQALSSWEEEALGVLLGKIDRQVAWHRGRRRSTLKGDVLTRKHGVYSVLRLTEPVDLLDGVYDGDEMCMRWVGDAHVTIPKTDPHVRGIDTSPDGTTGYGNLYLAAMRLHVARWWTHDQNIFSHYYMDMPLVEL